MKTGHVFRKKVLSKEILLVLHFVSSILGGFIKLICRCLKNSGAKNQTGYLLLQPVKQDVFQCKQKRGIELDWIFLADLIQLSVYKGLHAVLNRTC